MRRGYAAALSALIAGAPFAPPAAAAETRVSFSIQEARSYAFRLPLRSEVIQAARLRDEFDPCDPQEDPYRCDETRYNHDPNCPPAAALGPGGVVPRPRAAPGTERTTGGPGDRQGSDEAPARTTPVALNDLLSLATLSRFGASATAAGLASSSYVDLSGRQDPEAHTESDAFTPNVRDYEERCLPRDGVPEDHVHLLSRSEEAPATYHLAECHGRECTFFGGAAIGSDAERGRTIVDLAQRGDRVVGRMEAVLKEASWGDGQLRVDVLRTVVTFESDGTAEGLDWTVATTAEGATLGGRPVALPPGRVVSAGGLQAGVAAPYVRAAGNGGQLDIVAPGLFVAHQEQSAYFAGAEVTASFGRQPVTEFDPTLGDGGIVGGAGGFADLEGAFDAGTTTSPLPTPERTATAMPAAEDGTATEPSVSVVRLTTGTGAMAAVLSLVAAAFLLLLVRWIARYGWGRRLYRRQPLRAVDWLYRAFLKT